MGYKLTYLKVGCVGFDSEKQEYEEGEQVKVTYYPLGTDTIYSFHANADDVVTHLKGDVATITFTMPAHDVEVTCTSKSAMSVCGPDNSLFMGLGMLFPRMMSSDAPLQAAQQEPASEGAVIDTEWICPVCQAKNSGKFCDYCGTPRQK